MGKKIISRTSEWEITGYIWEKYHKHIFKYEKINHSSLAFPRGAAAKLLEVKLQNSVEIGLHKTSVYQAGRHSLCKLLWMAFNEVAIVAYMGDLWSWEIQGGKKKKKNTY